MAMMASERRFSTFSTADISTAHITRKDDELLCRKHPSIIRFKKDCGYFVYTVFANNNVEVLREKGFSEAFINLLLKAQSEDLKWLELDADGEIYPDLPQFKW